MSTPDTSSDDATLAAAEAFLSQNNLGRGTDHLHRVVAIARRLQGELKDANDDADSLAREKQHHEDMRRQAEAEARELRATIARVRALCGPEMMCEEGCHEKDCGFRVTFAAWHAALTGDKM